MNSDSLGLGLRVEHPASKGLYGRVILPESRLRTVLCAYVERLHKVDGPHADVPAPFIAFPYADRQDFIVRMISRDFPQATSSAKRSTRDPV